MTNQSRAVTLAGTSEYKGTHQDSAGDPASMTLLKLPLT